MTTCPGYVIDLRGRTDACPWCYRDQAHPERVRALHTFVCLVCGSRGRRYVQPWCCGQLATPSMLVPIPCKTCGVEFVRREGSQAHCVSCTPRQTEESRRRSRKAVSVEAARRVYPCATCIHGASSEHAETGWECIIQAAFTCAPYGAARLYKERVNG